MRTFRLVGAALLLAVVAHFVPARATAAEVKESNYKGWKTYELSNGLVDVQVAPDIGGRIIQYKLGDFEFLWVNDQLAGKMPPPTGLGPKGEWLNYGGDKLWPAPQGWSGENEWPGPPGPVPNAEGLPNRARIVGEKKGGSVEIELIAPKDQYAGIQFSRRIRVQDEAASVSIVSTMTNIDTKPRRWGIWEIAQINCAERKGLSFDKNVTAYCPMNPKSIFPNGFKVLYGAADNPGWQPDLERKIMKVRYVRQVGKVGLDSVAGWLAVVRGTEGRVLVERFKAFPKDQYPDDASVEFWLQAPGKFVAGGKEYTVADDPTEAPPYMEAELLSPYAELRPGQSYTFHNQWLATNIGGGFPILDCNELGVICEPLGCSAAWGATRLVVWGRFGIFHKGTVRIRFLNDTGKTVGNDPLEMPVSPDRAFTPLSVDWVQNNVNVPQGAKRIALILTNVAGKELGQLGRAPIGYTTSQVKP